MLAKFYIIWAFFLQTLFIFTSANKELKLLHVLSANKFYVPDYNHLSPIFTSPKNLTYEYFTKNSMDLPNSIKMRLYKLGELLRTHYDRFLGSLYTDEVIRMRTTEFNIPIMAGELINAGLWPPVDPQIWNKDLLWQPIPFEYKPAEEDVLLLGTLCPNFVHELNKALSNYKATAVEEKLFDLINKGGQVHVKNPIDVSLLYLALENSLELNQTLPDWLKPIFPSEDFFNVTMSAYDLLSKSIIQKRLNGGAFLKTIIKNSKNYINKTLNNKRKINIYSSDDRTFAGVLRNLNHPNYDLPKAGAALIFELLAEANNYWIKILYYDGNSSELLPIQLVNNETFISLEEFSKIIADVLPDNELSLCGSMIDRPPTGSANEFLISSYLLIIYIFIVNYYSYM